MSRPKLIWILGISGGLIAAGTLAFKVASLVMVPSRVDALERSSEAFKVSQDAMSRRIDSLAFDIQGLQKSADAQGKRTEDWQQRMTTVMSEMSGSVRSLSTSLEAQARDGIRVSEQVKNLQVVTDNLQSHK